MAVCTWCKQEMTTAASCAMEALHLRGEPVAMLAWGRERGWPTGGRRCGDCGVEPGGFHHLGCDIQRCPRCAGQMISCDCRYDEDPPDPDDDYDDENDDWDEDNNDLVYLKCCFEGADSLTALSTRLRGLADELDQQATEGWFLSAPVDGGYAHLTRTPPGRGEEYVAPVTEDM